MKLKEFNELPPEVLKELLSTCCGSAKWIGLMLQAAPYHSEEQLFEAADRSWQGCVEEDWLEAFRHHPKIGDLESLKKRFATTRHLAVKEQASVGEAREETLLALRDGNEAYEKKFGFIFIVFATGKSADGMLGLLEQRLLNDRGTELRTAAAEQHKITLLRLKKLLE